MTSIFKPNEDVDKYVKSKEADPAPIPLDVTPNLGLTKPAVGGDSNTWGDLINADLDIIDAAVANATFPQGTRLLFQQTNAPTGWVKDTTQNDKALRIVSGTAGVGGSTPFSTVMTSHTPSGSINSVATTGVVGGTALSVAQMPAHSHSQSHFSTGNTTASASTSGAGIASARNATPVINGVQTEVIGGGAAHDHPLTMNAHNHAFSGSAMDFAIQYVDAIIAVKS